MIGDRLHKVAFRNPGGTVPDGDGGFTNEWTDITPNGWYVSIAPASPQDLERFSASTITNQIVAIVKGPFHPGVTVDSEMVLLDRNLKFGIAGLRNIDYRSVSMELLAIEQGAADG